MMMMMMMIMMMMRMMTISDDDDHHDLFLYTKIHQGLNKSNTKRLVYTFTLNETYRVKKYIKRTM